MEHKIFVSLIISDFQHPPVELTRMLGAQPTKAWFAGDSIEKTLLNRKSNGWELSSGVSEYEHFEKHVNAIIDIIRSKKSKFLETLSTHKGAIWVSIYLSQSSSKNLPTVYLNKEALNMFSELNIEFNVETYIIP